MSGRWVYCGIRTASVLVMDVAGVLPVSIVDDAEGLKVK